MNRAKSFSISKEVVVRAWNKVKSNGGSSGIDRETIECFEGDLKRNLYKVWNRMSSGSYFPPAVKMVEIPKAGGGRRKLGIPTVSDRLAQMVAKIYMEPMIEPFFHCDSYGYRPNKSAHDAIKVTRERCWKYGWILEFDIRGMFDNIDHKLLLKAVQKHVQQHWLILYIERWIKAPVEKKDESIVNRTKGVPQGGVISPLLANLFMHYVFDKWMECNHPNIPFCRYADDGLLHCNTEQEAEFMKLKLMQRLEQCKLDLHQEKTKVACCTNKISLKSGVQRKFDFLGFQFRSRLCRSNQGKIFVGFTPAISPNASQSIRSTIRKWKLNGRTHLDLWEIAKSLNPIIRGWINYYGKYTPSALTKVMHYLNVKLLGWVKRKYKKHGKYIKRPKRWLGRVTQAFPNLFVHWYIVRFSAE